MLSNVDQVYFTNRKQLREWLDKNHDKVKSIWLVHDKFKNSRLSYNDLVEEALCFGWIDSTVKKLDESRNMIYFSRRNPKSIWSKYNKERVEKLITKKLMQPSGLAIIEQAKADGSWSEYDNVEKEITPPQLEKALSENKKAEENFKALSPSVRKQVLYFIYSAKQEETKLKRIEKIMPLIEKGKNPFI